ncbi:unnamed protein product [Rotaria magnacalcarata]|uniref:Uncharacterized protein n=1 Tax=Rotaria magnacalcarata TaxID=392030 RepID=A0A816THG8_9BILA|nr:unnamed protein product [Rotaria magnacalcarata]CAF2266693.1 unnamed protein product [Rotaria magnacalcarata]CAF3877695.1 unnamed protein product [Rotaria magnacalcarata]
MSLSKDYNTSLETFRIFWLDKNVHSEENKRSQIILRAIINNLKVFDDETECEKVIRDVSVADRIVLIVSGSLGYEIVPKVHNLEQLSSVYVFCWDKAKNEIWAQNFPKVKELYVKLDDLINRIQEDHKLRRMEEESLSMMTVFNTTGQLDQSSSGINGQFVHFQLLIDVLIRMKPNVHDKKELIALCKQEYSNNETEMKNLRDFKQNYLPDMAIWWYTRESFIYKTLNKALRVQNIDLLFLFRFFIRDIHQQLCENQEPSTFEVFFRGQWMSNDEIDKLKHSIGNFISMNSFLSTSKKESVARQFLEDDSDQNDTSKQKVLFKITVDPQVGANKPFADISHLSCVKREAEVLFMIGSIFRLDRIQEGDSNNNQLKIFEMSLCGEKYGLKKLFEFMRNEYDIEETNLLSFGNVLRSMGKINHAEKYYRRLLNELHEDDPLLAHVYYNIGLVAKLKCDYDNSMEYYRKALKISMEHGSVDNVIIAKTHNGIGEILWKNGEKNQALESFKEAVKIFEQAKLGDRAEMALFQDNIGLFYREQSNYHEALFCYARSLMIRQKCLPKNHPDLAMSYNNVGNIRLHLNHQSIALECLKKALEIRTKAFPPDHPDIASSQKNLGDLYESTNEFRLALECFHNASEIYHKIWQPNHPDVIEINADIQRVSDKLENA